MSETLAGVVIGGLIASISPLTTLFLEQRKWKREKRLQFLIDKRTHLKEHMDSILEELSTAMAENNYPAKMTADIMVLMPKAVSDAFRSWVHKETKEDKEFNQAFLEVTWRMNEALATIDEKIEKELQ